MVKWYFWQAPHLCLDQLVEYQLLIQRIANFFKQLTCIPSQALIWEFLVKTHSLKKKTEHIKAKRIIIPEKSIKNHVDQKWIWKTAHVHFQVSDKMKMFYHHVFQLHVGHLSYIVLVSVTLCMEHNFLPFLDGFSRECYRSWSQRDM